MEVKVEDLDFKKGGGLIPVVAQDCKDKDVLMLAYMNREALERTLETGFAHYWSRSRGRLWKKGETSGNTQRVREIRIDCDRDAILLLVDQEGNACHTGEWSCFHNQLRSHPGKKEGREN
jgi:phosphoribosyl-AMP cyclohydrolase